LDSAGAEPFVRLAWTVAAVALGATSLLAIRVVTMRRTGLAQARRREEVLARWRPVLFEGMLGGDPKLPPLLPRDEDTFLLLWNQLQDAVRGDGRVRLAEFAERLGVRDVARARLRRPDALGRLLGLRTLGFLGVPRDYEEVASALDDRKVYLALAAARALVFIDARAAPADVLPRLAMRPEWPVALFATVLAAADPAELAERFALLEPQLSSEQLVRLLPLVSVLEPRASERILEALLLGSGDVEVLAAALKRVRSPSLAAAVRPLARHEAWTVRTQAASALGRVGTPGDRDLLVGMLTDRQWWVRYRAAQSLLSGRFGEPAEVRALATALGDRFARDMVEQVLAEEHAAA
jgi:HEAT repeat protein